MVKKNAPTIGEIAETLLPSKPTDVLELDEIWSYVLKKTNQRYIWLALCRRTKPIVAYYIGDRREEGCYQFWLNIPKDYYRWPTFNDMGQAYQNVFSAGEHHCVNKQAGQTAHIERFNNTLRQHLARFVSKTLSFSQADFYHDLGLKLLLFAII